MNRNRSRCNYLWAAGVLGGGGLLVETLVKLAALMFYKQFSSHGHGSFLRRES